MNKNRNATYWNYYSCTKYFLKGFILFTWNSYMERQKDTVIQIYIEREKERQWEVLVHSPNGFYFQGWTRQKPEDRSFLWVSHIGVKAKALSPSSAHLPGSGRDLDQKWETGAWTSSWDAALLGCLYLQPQEGHLKWSVHSSKKITNNWFLHLEETENQEQNKSKTGRWKEILKFKIEMNKILKI